MALAGGLPSEFIIIREHFDIHDYLNIITFRLKQVEKEPDIEPDEEYYN